QTSRTSTRHASGSKRRSRGNKCPAKPSSTGWLASCRSSSGCLRTNGRKICMATSCPASPSASWSCRKRWPMRHSPASLQLTASMPASLRHSSISSSAPQGMSQLVRHMRIRVVLQVKSLGTFAVVSMMTHAVKTKMLAAEVEGGNSTLAANGEAGVGADDVLELTSSLTFGVGVFLTLMGIFRLSFLTRYMSDPLVSGFTTGCAVHVFMSQVPKALGVKTPPRSGNGMILKMLYDDAMALPNANLYTVGIAAVGIVFLSVGRDYVNPWFKKRYRIPLPLELFLVIIAIGASQLLNLELNYGVKIVKHVPQGIPSPSLPNFALLRTIWPDALAIAVICYMFVFSMGQLFAKKHKYQIDANQACLTMHSSDPLL
ncbi:sulfate permease, partial [Aphelenchoides avenae]